jgi:hypothetical protein
MDAILHLIIKISFFCLYLKGFISFMEESVLIQRCLKQDYTAQEFLYKKYAPRFLALILRYIPRRDDAEDVLVESIFKIFGITNINFIFVLFAFEKVYVIHTKSLAKRYIIYLRI